VSQCPVTMPLPVFVEMSRPAPASGPFQVLFNLYSMENLFFQNRWQTSKFFLLLLTDESTLQPYRCTYRCTVLCQQHFKKTSAINFLPWFSAWIFSALISRYVTMPRDSSVGFFFRRLVTKRDRRIRTLMTMLYHFFQPFTCSNCDTIVNDLKWSGLQMV
jgi:hypothetical protein